MIDKLLKNKTVTEKADIKGKEIAKIDFSGKYKSNGIEIEIISIKSIKGGVEIFARAWKDSRPVGFGKDGTIEIERFRIFNPPVLVDDTNGTIIRKGGVDKITGETKPDRKLREDPVEAIQQTIIHNVKVVGLKGDKIVKGKVGNTTSTFYPDAGSGSVTVDGRVYSITSANWATIRSQIPGDGATTTETIESFGITGTTSWDQFIRLIFTLDTSILSTDIINSAIFSLYVTAIPANPETFSLVGSTPAVNNNLAVGDYNQLQSIKFATDVPLNIVSSYNDWTLNTTGISAINKTGVTAFGVLSSEDNDNTEPAILAYKAQIYFADQTGTASDPKLVVVHSAPLLTDNAPFFGCAF